MKPVYLLTIVMVMPLVGCVSTPAHTSLAEAQPVFSPQAFFNGKTVGEGTLSIEFSGSQHTHVVGRGHVESDGTLVLVQKVDVGDEPTYTRTWRMRPIGDGRFTGTLTDAQGPIRAEVHGNRLHIRFQAKEGGLAIEQWLYLQPGGRVALNRMVARKFGIAVASLEERITKR